MKYVGINLINSTPFFQTRSGDGLDFAVERMKRVSLKSSRMPKRSSGRQKLSIWLKRVSMVFFGLSALLVISIFIPQVRDFVDTAISGKYAQVFSRPTKTFGDKLVASGDKIPEPPYQPVKNMTLSSESRLVIEEIGVDALIHEGTQEDVEEVLVKGVWRAKDFGTPYGRKMPTILASHRFGYLSWTNAYRRANSFYSLPSLEKGDEVKILWSQREYVYEVYKTEEGKEIGDYQADLILYTCRFLDSDVRIFVYARLLEA